MLRGAAAEIYIFEWNFIYILFHFIIFIFFEFYLISVLMLFQEDFLQTQDTSIVFQMMIIIMIPIKEITNMRGQSMFFVKIEKKNNNEIQSFIEYQNSNSFYCLKVWLKK